MAECDKIGCNFDFAATKGVEAKSTKSNDYESTTQKLLTDYFLFSAATKRPITNIVLTDRCKIFRNVTRYRIFFYAYRH